MGRIMFVLGTAGHVDHGKSVLVRALTGIDPDRLREEKERGMTIDLGFAWLKLPSGQEVGIVDVPGHEHFVQNMLAGVGGIDLALLVIAANEGVMPQTREHLAILDLFGIQHGVVVITKKDLVDEEWLGLVRVDVEELIRHTSLSQALIVAVSAVTGEGLSELVSTIDKLLNSTEPRKDVGRPRLPIDRIFTIAGSGTIVTGTLIDGSLDVGQEIEIVPPALRSRIRGLQTHKARLNTATPGSRVAANLVGVAKSHLQRGDVLTKPDWLTPTTMLTVQLRLLPYLRRPLQHNTTVSFHTGTTEAIAKVRLLEEEKLQPGEITLAQLLLSKSVALVKGDHFVLRSPVETLGGGKVIEPHTRRYRRFRPAIIQSLRVKDKGTIEDIIFAVLEAEQPLELPSLLAQCDVPAIEAQPAIESLVQQSRVIRIGHGKQYLLMTISGWKRLTEKAITALQDYHRKFPARLGMPEAELSSQLKIRTHFSAVLQRLLDESVIIEDDATIRLTTHHVQLTEIQQAKIDVFLEALVQNPYAPSSEVTLEPDLLNLLTKQHQVVKVSDGVVFSTAAYNEMVEKVTSHLKTSGKVTLAEVRDMFKTSRKYALALLEHLDRTRITRRVGDERVPY